MKAIVPQLAGSLLVVALLGGCASTDSAAARRSQQQNYADIQKEMEAYAIRRQMDHNIREAEAALEMPGGLTALPEFR